MNKAIFLDRDGVINKELGDYVYQLEQLVIVDGVADSLGALKEMGYIFIVITNQSGIAKGIYTHEDVEAIHNSIQEEFMKQNIEIQAFYYCPHHPEHGRCLCRKPEPLMIEKALARFNIYPSSSFFVGDMERDIAAADAAGSCGCDADRAVHLRDRDGRERRRSRPARGGCLRGARSTTMPLAAALRQAAGLR